MDGDISLKASSEYGSTFEFHVTLNRNIDEVHLVVKPPILKDVRILVVDDLPVIRTILMEQLTMAGMKCDTAASGHEALTMMQKAQDLKSKYDLVVIDYLMPDMNGDALARCINDEPDLRDTCLVMLSTAGNPVLNEDARKKGFSAYIAKPVRYTQLVDMIALIWKKYSEGNKVGR